MVEKTTSTITEKTITPITLWCVVSGVINVLGLEGSTGQGDVGGGRIWWPPAGGLSDGSRAGVSNKSNRPGLSLRPRKGKLQAGSLPGFWALLGIHLRG